MPGHTATIRWRRAPDQPFTDGRFSRAHRWAFDGGLTLPASSSPQVLPRQSDPAALDPEEALVAALASCHMMTFLHLAARAGLVVDGYDDHAQGRLSRSAEGRIWLSHVTLRPDVTWAGPAPAPETVTALHQAAHRDCFIANSVKTEIRIEPV